jgi:hypothetical protein
VQIDTSLAAADIIDYAPTSPGTKIGVRRNIYQPIRRPRKKPLFVVFCLMLAVSPSSASLWCFSCCFAGRTFDTFGSSPGSLLRLAGGTGGILLDIA